jgi:hypothetical protein
MPAAETESVRDLVRMGALLTVVEFFLDARPALLAADRSPVSYYSHRSFGGIRTRGGNRRGRRRTGHSSVAFSPRVAAAAPSASRASWSRSSGLPRWLPRSRVPARLGQSS